MISVAISIDGCGTHLPAVLWRRVPKPRGEGRGSPQRLSEGGEGLFLDLSRYRFPGTKKRLHRGAFGALCGLRPVPGLRVQGAQNRGFQPGPQQGRAERIHFPTLRAVVAHKPLIAGIAGFGVGLKAGESPVEYRPL